MDTYKAFFNFLIKPYINRRVRDISFNNKLLELVLLFILKLILSLIIVIIIKVLTNIENTSISNLKDNWPFLKLLILGGVFMPIAEETVFRLSLIFRSKYLFFSSLLLAYALITRLYFETSLFNTNGHVLERILFPLIISFFIYLVSQRNKAQFKKFWQVNFKWILYSLILAFGLLHLENFNISGINYFWTPLIILPQCISGAIYSYIRINHGFAFACTLHIVNNIFVIIL